MTDGQFDVAPTFTIARITTPEPTNPVIVGRHYDDVRLASVGEAIGGLGTYWTIVLPPYGEISIYDLGTDHPLPHAPGPGTAIVNNTNIWYYSPSQNAMTIDVDASRGVVFGGGAYPAAASLDWTKSPLVAFGTGSINETFQSGETVEFTFAVTNMHPRLQLQSCAIGVSFDAEAFSAAGLTVNLPLSGATPYMWTGYEIPPLQSLWNTFSMTASSTATPGTYSFSLIPLRLAYRHLSPEYQDCVSAPQTVTVSPGRG